jgi:hypothetical protein
MSKSNAHHILPRPAALSACLATLVFVLAMLGGAASASASNEEFCVFKAVESGRACVDGTFRKITRVNATSINFSVCAGAFNSNGVEIGGWTCTAEAGETSNGAYDGTKFLKGAVLNNAGVTQTIGRGLEFYNP